MATASLPQESVAALPREEVERHDRDGVDAAEHASVGRRFGSDTLQVLALVLVADDGLLPQVLIEILEITLEVRGAGGGSHLGDALGQATHRRLLFGVGVAGHITQLVGVGGAGGIFGAHGFYSCGLEIPPEHISDGRVGLH